MKQNGYAFSTYAYKVIKNEINLEFRKINRNKNIHTISLETPIIDNLTIGDTLENDYDIDQDIINNEYINKFNELLNSNLIKENEYQILILRLEGKSLTEIGKIIGRSKALVSQKLISIKKRFFKDNIYKF